MRCFGWWLCYARVTMVGRAAATTTKDERSGLEFEGKGSHRKTDAFQPETVIVFCTLLIIYARVIPLYRLSA